MIVHSVLPPRLAAEVDLLLVAEGIGHLSHATKDVVAAGVAAAEDDDAVALIGPYRSREVAETVEATAPAGLALIAPMATWAGVTRDDEPGCDDDPADHRGTVFRLLARDTEVAARISADVRTTGRRAYVIAGIMNTASNWMASCAALDCRARLKRRQRTSWWYAVSQANRKSNVPDGWRQSRSWRSTACRALTSGPGVTCRLPFRSHHRARSRAPTCS
jgi:hypothetical protein